MGAWVLINGIWYKPILLHNDGGRYRLLGREISSTFAYRLTEEKKLYFPEFCFYSIVSCKREVGDKIDQ